LTPFHPLADSNKPLIGRKRRRSEDEDEDDDAPSVLKKPKGLEESIPEEANGASSRGDSPAVVVTPGNEAAEVKEVTKGVKEVELKENKKVEGTRASEKSASSLPETQVDEKQAGTESADVKAPGSPMKDVKHAKSAITHASKVEKELPAPPSELPVITTSKPKSKKSNTPVAAKKVPASPPRKKKPLPTRKSASSKVISSDADVVKDKTNAAVTVKVGKEDAAA
jgi:hypothetical protein